MSCDKITCHSCHPLTSLPILPSGSWRSQQTSWTFSSWRTDVSLQEIWQTENETQSDRHWDVGRCFLIFYAAKWRLWITADVWRLPGKSSSATQRLGQWNTNTQEAECHLVFLDLLGFLQLPDFQGLQFFLEARWSLAPALLVLLWFQLTQVAPEGLVDQGYLHLDGRRLYLNSDGHYRQTKLQIWVQICVCVCVGVDVCTWFALQSRKTNESWQETDISTVHPSFSIKTFLLQSYKTMIQLMFTMTDMWVAGNPPLLYLISSFIAASWNIFWGIFVKSSSWFIYSEFGLFTVEGEKDKRFLFRDTNM